MFRQEGCAPRRPGTYDVDRDARQHERSLWAFDLRDGHLQLEAASSGRTSTSTDGSDRQGRRHEAPLQGGHWALLQRADKGVRHHRAGAHQCRGGNGALRRRAQPRALCDAAAGGFFARLRSNSCGARRAPGLLLQDPRPAGVPNASSRAGATRRRRSWHGDALPRWGCGLAPERHQHPASAHRLRHARPKRLGNGRPGGDLHAAGSCLHPRDVVPGHGPARVSWQHQLAHHQHAEPLVCAGLLPWRPQCDHRELLCQVLSHRFGRGAGARAPGGCLDSAHGSPIICGDHGATAFDLLQGSGGCACWWLR
mmetsp:Transcript_53624/g.128240  ORF Transcript_53624/g.128240 Transcript_53624/m.128240 type:complete len:310 (+) Transcript_53624:2712-3641(+)